MTVKLLNNATDCGSGLLVGVGRLNLIQVQTWRVASRNSPDPELDLAQLKYS